MTAATGDLADILRRADTAAAGGRAAEAEHLYRAALAVEPNHAEALHDLALLCANTGRLDEAEALLRRTLAADGGSAEARVHLGRVLQALNRADEALACFDAALAGDEDDAEALFGRAVALQALGRHAEAIAAYERVLTSCPGDADAANNLGLALQDVGRLEAALAQHRAALAMRPGFAAAHNNLGRALQALDRHEEAIAQYRLAIAAGPGQAARHANLGVALQEIGRLDEAAAVFTQAIALAPRSGRLWRNLADCRRFAAGDPEIAAMQRLAAERATLPEEEQRQLLFALARALADSGDREGAFRCMAEGNALKRRQIGYDEAATLGRFTRIAAVFDYALFERLRGQGARDTRPVFIIGMPRSGTTLVEQILAGHDQVFAAGELSAFGDAAASLGDDAGGGSLAFPDIARTVSGAQLRALGDAYLAGVPMRAATAARVTDKMPLNFLFAGLVHLALPDARIIHLRRDPVDTCFSCFATLFTGNHQVAYDLGELGRYYRAYERLMAHWRSVLPAGVLLDVRYEALVADLAGEARRIVDHCGLEWRDACLDFHRTSRPVRTASVAQVRQPIHRGALGRSGAYRPWLGPLLDALGEGAGAP